VRQAALANIESRLRGNRYPGRGIIIGKNEAGQWIQVYWIMGRSENSRNRVFVVEDGLLKTHPAELAKVKDPSLIIYNAMRERDGKWIVSNGDQTDTIYEGIGEGLSFEQALASRNHEPDDPNWTPRISGLVDLTQNDGPAWLSIIKLSPFSTEYSEHQCFRYACVQSGFGYAITTYREDGNPIPAFEGTPYIVPLQGTAQDIGDFYWQVLDDDNKISLAVRQINADGKADIVVLNKYAAS
jgi:IMP cyclohydrolase